MATKRQRLVVDKLNEIGLVDEVDALDLAPNAMTGIRNLKPRKGRLHNASKVGPSISASSIFGGTDYRHIKLWKPYRTQNPMAICGNGFWEYCTADGYRSAIPYWLGVFGASAATGVITGKKLGSAYTAGDVFASNPGEMMNTDDKVFISEFGTAWIDEHTTAADGNLPAAWTQTSGTIAVSSNKFVGGASGGWAVHGTDSSANPNNVFASIRYAAVDKTKDTCGVGLFLRDSVTKMGYAIDINYCHIETDYGGPDEYMYRVYGGYLNETALFNYGLLLTNINTENDYWEDYDDLWIWYRKPFFTFGYGKRAVYSLIAEMDFTNLEMGISLSSGATIGPKQGTTDNPIVAYEMTDAGPYAVSAVSYASNSITATGLTTVKKGIVWGAKKCAVADMVIRPAQDAVLRTSSDLPMMLWKGGMLPEYNPLQGVDIGGDTWPAYAGWGCVDMVVYNGRIFIGGPRIFCNLYNVTGGYYDWVQVGSYPEQLRWCYPYDYDDWTDTNLAGFVNLVDTPGPVQAVRLLSDTLMVYKTDAIVQLNPTGISTDPFQIRYYDHHDGVDGPHDVVEAGPYNFYSRNGGIYVVNTNEASIVPTASGLTDYYDAYGHLSDSTVMFGGYDATNGYFTARGYNYKLGSMYEVRWTSLVGFSDEHNYYMALKNDGAVYGTSAQTKDTATTFNPYSTTAYFETPQLTMGDAGRNKTIFAVDVFTRCTYTGGYTPSIKLTPIVNGTTGSTYTVTSETIGNDVYRARFTFKANGLYFKFKIESNDAPGYIGTVDFIRYEIDWQFEEPDQRTTST